MQNLELRKSSVSSTQHCLRLRKGEPGDWFGLFIVSPQYRGTLPGDRLEPKNSGYRKPPQKRLLFLIQTRFRLLANAGLWEPQT